jgi:hypothetical protein
LTEPMQMVGKCRWVGDQFLTAFWALWDDIYDCVCLLL